MPDLSLILDAVDVNFGDLEIIDGDLTITQGRTAIRQNVLQNLRTFLGEWFLNIELGIPFFQQILVKSPDIKNINGIFIDCILGTPGVKTLTAYSFETNYESRVMDVTFRAVTDDGEIDYSGLLTV